MTSYGIGTDRRLELSVFTLHAGVSNVQIFCCQLSTQLKKVLRQLQDEQALNKSLTTNQNHWLSKVEKLEQQKTDREQVTPVTTESFIRW